MEMVIKMLHTVLSEMAAKAMLSAVTWEPGKTLAFPSLPELLAPHLKTEDQVPHVLWDISDIKGHEQPIGT
jgi:hypothetical protein